MNKPEYKNNAWNDYSSYVKNTFGQRVQKISVNAGFSCPNRSKIDNSGCIYCNNKSFSPFYCNPETPIKQQLQKGIDFFGKKYKAQKYLAYFQSGTNTYAHIETLKRVYSEALSVDGVIGLVIGTRPDCIDDKKLEMISKLAMKKYVAIEYGAESTKNQTLNLINRGHSWEDTKNAIIKTNRFGIKTGLHIIIGLPGEEEKDFYNHAREIAKLPIDLLKIHQMQILKNTKLENLYRIHPELFIKLPIENYSEIIVKFCELLSPKIIIERFTSESPQDILVAPNWGGKKNFEVSHIIEKKFKENETYQGALFR